MNDLEKYIRYRDSLLFGGEIIDWTFTSSPKWFSGIMFDSLFELLMLNKHRRVDCLDVRQNDSPTVGDFLNFLGGNEEFTAHGYAQKPGGDRDIVIEGLEYIIKDGEYRQDLEDNLERWCYLTRKREWKAPDKFISNNEKIFCWWD